MELQDISPQRITPAVPTFVESLGIYLLSGALLIVFGARIQQNSLFLGLFVTEILFVVSPAFAYSLACHYDLRRTFLLIPASVRTALLSVIIACAGFALVSMMTVVQEYIFPRSLEYQAAWEALLQKFHALPLGLTLGAVAVLPGVCEELFFRGFVLRGMRQRCSDGFAIILVGLLFGAFHFDPYRLFPTSLLGMLFGYMVVKTGSLVPAMIAHAVNNSIAILIAFAAQTLPAQADASFTPLTPDELFSLPYLLAALPVALIAASALWLGLRALPVAADVYREPSSAKLISSSLEPQADEEDHLSSVNLCIKEEK